MTGARPAALGAVLATLLLGAVLLPGAAVARQARPAEAIFPVFDVGGDDHALGQDNDLFFDFYDMDAAPAAAEITISSPPGYVLSLVHRAGFIFGDAEVDTNRGIYKGEFAVAGRAEFDADPATAGCADGTHAATWWLVLNGTHGELSVPVAVDRKGTGDLFTVCLGSLQKLHLTMNELYFNTRDVFRNPSKQGDYRFSAIVTPAGADGTPDPTTRYELRAFQPLPETRDPDGGLRPDDEAAHRHREARRRRATPASGSTSTSTPARARTTRSSSRSGTRRRPAGVPTPSPGSSPRRRSLRMPTSSITAMPSAPATSSAPAGCASQSTDGLATDTVKVTTTAS